MGIQYAEICDIGLKAKENQDRVLCLSDGMSGLFAVADGMGGLTGGGFASQTVKEELEIWWHHYAEETCPVKEGKNGMEGLKAALQRANRKILEASAEGKRCGTTVVALLLENGRYAVVSCGDSRCYRTEKKRLFTRFGCVTKDDVWENLRENIRGLNEEEVRKHRNKGKLIRAVGTCSEFSCDVFTGRLTGKNVFFLCSDGLHKRVAEEEIENAMKQAFAGRKEILQSECEGLKEQVYRKGAGDNISVIMVCCRENG